MSFDVFVHKLSEQLGFSVKGRMYAVVPKGLASMFVTNDVKIKVDEVEQWWGVLDIWQNAEQKVCEFVVEKAIEG
jgi:hypothetical protein